MHTYTSEENARNVLLAMVLMLPFAVIWAMWHQFPRFMRVVLGLGIGSCIYLVLRLAET
jgi:hypothetical protein